MAPMTILTEIGKILRKRTINIPTLYALHSPFDLEHIKNEIIISKNAWLFLAYSIIEVIMLNIAIMFTQKLATLT
jgi:hypothetical protein